MLASLLTAAMAANPFVQSGAIVVATFILEDATTVLVGMMSADRMVSPLVALLALYAGIALGDLGLYLLGHLAQRHRWARRFVPAAKTEMVRRWLGPRLGATVAAVRFLPGLRLPVYTACGFMRMPLGRFAAAVVLATIVWTTLLFGLSYGFGSWATDRIGIWRWPLGLAIAALVILTSRRLTRSRTGELGAAS
jgi:membrane protein DedA with SNARE-associated domain